MQKGSICFFIYKHLQICCFYPLDLKLFRLLQVITDDNWLLIALIMFFDLGGFNVISQYFSHYNTVTYRSWVPGSFYQY